MLDPQSPSPAPPQFTLRQALLAIGGLCIVLAVYRAVGLSMGTAVLIVSALVIGLIIARDRREWYAVGLIAFMLLVIVSLMIPSTGSRPVTPRSNCHNNLRQIAVALHCYHDTYGSFPPAYIADKNGRPMHSWRVLILPFMEQQQVYDLYRFDEPWDGPNNRRLHGHGLPYIRCPAEVARGQRDPMTETSYVVVVGSKTAFPGDKCVALGDIADDHENTILVVEVAGSGIHWMEPRDLHVTQMARAINPAKGQGISSRHKLGAHAILADGSVQYLDAVQTTEADIQAMLTIDGDEPSPRRE